MTAILPHEPSLASRTPRPWTLLLKAGLLARGS